MPPEQPASERLVIPYGIARVTPETMDRVPTVEIDKAAHRPLRLGDGPYRPNVVADEMSLQSVDGDIGIGAARLDILRRLHLRDCDAFDKNLRQWVGLYFDFVLAQASSANTQEPALTLTPETAFDPILWAMAALRPLPRAHIPTADGGHVAVDVAFWDGREITALVFAGGEKVQAAERVTNLARLLVVAPPARADVPDVIASQLGELVLGFRRGIAVPADPFGPTPFRARPAAAPSF